MLRAVGSALRKAKTCEALARQWSPALAALSPAAELGARSHSSSGPSQGSQWEILAKQVHSGVPALLALTAHLGAPKSALYAVVALQGYDVNPCHSKLHPAVTEAGIDPDEDEELPVQEAYTPESECWGCGALACGPCIVVPQSAAAGVSAPQCPQRS